MENSNENDIWLKKIYKIYHIILENSVTIYSPFKLFQTCMSFFCWTQNTKKVTKQLTVALFFSP